MLGWADSTLWWLAAGTLVAVELATGTFYLLMLALGAAAGALAAHAGLGLNVQLLAAAVVGAASVALWHRRRGGSAARDVRPATANPDVLLDIGQTVHVDAWDAEGRARVAHRGAAWQARRAAPGMPGTPGPHRIEAVDGSTLLLAPLAAAAAPTSLAPGPPR